MSIEKTNKNLALQSYDEYKALVQEGLKRKKCKAKNNRRVKENDKKFLSVFCVDFTPIHEKLKGLYSGKGVGRVPYDPQILLRSLLLMHAMAETSITKWASEVAHDERIVQWQSRGDDSLIALFS